MAKVKWMRTADCGRRWLPLSCREARSRILLLGLYDEDGKLDHVGFTSDDLQRRTRRADRPSRRPLREPPRFYRQSARRTEPLEYGARGDWEPLRAELVVEVRFDHVTGNCFRHGTKLLRWRPDKGAPPVYV